MFDWGFIIVICVVILILLHKILIASVLLGAGHHLLYGFWQAHPAFCTESGTDMFVIYLGPNNQCLIMIMAGTNIIANHLTTYNIKPVVHWPTISKLKYNIVFDILPENMKNEFPHQQNLEFIINKGKLVLSDDSKIYFVGYKDNKLSDLVDVV